MYQASRLYIGQCSVQVLRKSIKKWVSNCSLKIWSQNFKKCGRARWHEKYNKQISYDLITNLPISNGFDSLLIMVDHGLSKGVILCPTKKTITAEGVAIIIFRKLYTRFSLFNKIISEWGPQFAAHFQKELGRILGYELALYPPTTLKLTEKQPGTRNLPPDILWVKPLQMGQTDSHGRIHPQHLTSSSFHHQKISSLPYNELQTTGPPWYH